ncbi:hypothetical protein [Nonomuraea sp. KM90]|uniref:hypothetical protein n=1 Tax=Nonomuraea sp. KM90 TaxID=3457428 RepID=UPI003FCED056
MAKTTRTFLLAALTSALGISALCALPPVGGFLLGRAIAAALVFPGLGQGPAVATAGALAAFSVGLTGLAYLAFRWSGFGASWIGLLVCWGLAGGPAGVVAVLAWVRWHGVPFDAYARYAASWGMATALLAALLALAATRVLPATPAPKAPGTPAGSGEPVKPVRKDPAAAPKKPSATAKQPAAAGKTATTKASTTKASTTKTATKTPTKAATTKAGSAKAGAVRVSTAKPAGGKEPAAGPEGASTGESRWSFRPRSWVLPCLAAGWAIVWSVLLRAEQPLLAWLPLSLNYFDQVAVVLATIAAGSLEGVLRRRLPVEGRPGRAFVLAWISLSVAPVVYAAVVAIDRGMRELLLARPLSAAWVAEYAGDMTAALVAQPAQVAVPPLLLALVATGVQQALPHRQGPPAEPDPVRTDRRWSLLVAGAAVALTYFCVAVTSRFPLLTRRTFDAETPVMVRALALLAPPDPALGRTVVVWLWAVAAVFGVSAAVLVYVAVRGQLVRVFPATSYLVLVAALALATALAWNAGSVIGHALTGERPLGISPAAEAAEFCAFVVPVFGALLFIVHSQVGVSRFAGIVELEGEQTWEKVTERYRAWKEQVSGHVPGRRERGLIAARAAGGALVLAVAAGAVRAFGGGGQAELPGSGVFLAAPVLSAGVPAAENLTGALYLVLLAGLVYAALTKVNLQERRWSVWLTVWGLSVVAGAAAALATPAGMQLGLVAGPFAVAGLVVAARRRVLLAGGVVLVLVALAPLVRGAPPREPVAVVPGAWRERLPGLVIDVSYPRARGGPDTARVDAALMAPVKAYVDEALRRHREGAGPGAVTGSFVVVRADAEVVSVRYALAGEIGRAVTYDVAAGEVLTVRDLFVPHAFTPAGRRQMADALRPLMPKGQNPRTVSVDSDRLLVNLAVGAVEFTFGRDYFCTPCSPFTVRVPDGRLTGLLRR